MKRLGLALVFFVTSLSLNVRAEQAGHTSTSTRYTQDGADAYTAMRHGPDGAVFLDPYFMKHLDESSGQNVLDAGCGAAPWAIYAARRGAHVEGIDIHPRMIEQAQAAIKEASIKDRVNVQIGDVTLLPYRDHGFDKAISINVGCNLSNESLLAHVKEMARTLKSDGLAILTAPTSFGTLFTTGQRPDEEVLKDIESVLSKIGESKEAEVIVKNLNTLTDVNRATFVFRNNRLVLAQKNTVLVSGEPIWRKLPGALTVPNFYHAESEYVQAFQEADFKSIEFNRPSFVNGDERVARNSGKEAEKQLGAAYVGNPAFVVYTLRK